VQLKAPSPVVDGTPLQEIAAVPVHVTVQAELPAYPVPVTVTTEPTTPLVGETVRAEFTVNVALAVLGVGEALSVAVTAWAPCTPEGTVNVQLNPPRATVVAEHRVAPPGAQVTVTAERPAKPVPVAVTGPAPTIPLDGESVTLGLTVNVAVAVFGVGVALSVAVTVWAPAIPTGTVKVQVKPPEAELVAVQRVAPPGLQVTVIPEAGAKPVPVAVTGPLPTIPLDGESVTLGMTVNVAVAEFGVPLDAVPVTV
jgi:hypothetical protein